MHGHTFALYASTVALLSTCSLGTVSAREGTSQIVPNYKFQRRAYRHNEDLRMRIRRLADGNGEAHALKARFTPPAGGGNGAVDPVTPTSGVAIPLPVQVPNAAPGDNTPDNV